MQRLLCLLDDSLGVCRPGKVSGDHGAQEDKGVEGDKGKFVTFLTVFRKTLQLKADFQRFLKCSLAAHTILLLGSGNAMRGLTVSGIKFSWLVHVKVAYK